MNESKKFAVTCPAPDAPGDVVEIAHGGGGRLTKRLIDTIFRPAFGASPEDFTHDGAVFDVAGATLAFTTDSYVVRPLFFPGGDIGSLAVNGTVNDLAMCGATPLYLSAGLVIEAGFSIADLKRVVASMQAAADAAGVRLVTGDTKVVERGKGDGLYINTSGVGQVRIPISPKAVRPGDAIVLSGDIGRHGIAVMAARENLGFETEIVSDCAPLSTAVAALIDEGLSLHCLRDLTRGGLATALIEIAEAAGVAMKIDGAKVAVSEPIRGACEILGLDPLYVANEGRFIAILPQAEVTRALAALGPDAAVIGYVESEASPGNVQLETLGGRRVLDLLSGEQLPRIC